MQSDLKHIYPWAGMLWKTSHLSSVLAFLKSLLLPLLAGAYLTFCYVVRYYNISISAGGIANLAPQNIGELCSLVYSVKPQAPSSSFNQSWCDIYQHHDSHTKPLAIA